MSDGDCIFCMIVAGELPSARIYDDEHAIAFLDINPWTRGHSLVVPRNHSRDLLEAPDEDLWHVIVACKHVAGLLTDRLSADGINLLNSCGAAAWQSVFHLHMHVIPRYADDPLRLPGQPMETDPDELARLAEEIRA